MRRAIAVVVTALAGCDQLFDLDHISKPRDGAVVPVDDARSDAAPCVPGGPDEDGDGTQDNCDRCPTVADNDLDDDGDGLPNACDPNLGVIGMDQILLAVMFSRSEDLSRFEVSQNVTASPAGTGTVLLGTSATIRTLAVYDPTRIEVRFSGAAITAGGSTATMSVKSILSECRVNGAGCLSTAGQTCITGVPGLTSATWPAATSTVRILSMHADQSTHCTVGTAQSQAMTGTTAPIGLGVVELLTNNLATAQIESLVVYGAKQP